MSDSGAEWDEMGDSRRLSETEIDRLFAGIPLNGDGAELAEVSELLAKIRDEYTQPPPPPLERDHVAALVAESRRVAAEGNGAVAAPVARPTGPRRRSIRWRLAILYAGLVALMLPISVAGLAVAGVQLPGALTAPFSAIGIDLPNQDDTSPDAIDLPAIGMPDENANAGGRGGERGDSGPAGSGARGGESGSSAQGQAGSGRQAPAGGRTGFPALDSGSRQAPPGSGPRAGNDVPGFNPPASPGATPQPPSSTPKSPGPSSPGPSNPGPGDPGASGSGPPSSPPGNSAENPFGGPPGITDEGAPGQTGAAPPERGKKDPG